MSDVIEKLRRRRAYPVQLGEDTVHIRQLTFAEQRTAETIADNERRGWFIIGTVLCDGESRPTFQRVETESADQFAERVRTSLDDVPQDAFPLIFAAFQGLMEKPQSVRNLEKN